MNYIYFQTSDKAAQVGDLTETGIINRVEFPRIYTTDQLYESLVPNRIIPLLIMDAPEYSMNKIHYYDDEDLWVQRFKEITSMPSISSLSNEQVYKYLKSKGIKPDTDLLIEFDGEVEFHVEPCSNCDPLECKSWVMGDCNDDNKVAIIKDTEVKQESEEKLWFHALYEIVDVGRQAHQTESDIVEYLKQHFKIERRK